MKARRARVLVSALVGAALLTGCETQPLLKGLGIGGDGGVNGIFSNSVVAKDAPLPDAPARQWADLDTDVNNYRVAGWGLVSMPQMQAYLNRLYASVKAAGGKPDWPGSVYIIADPALRATSTAAGNVFISLGWLRTIESEDEMSALLAHEFGHVYLNHHAGHEVGNTADTASWLAAAAWMIVNKKVGVNAAYAISGVRALGSGVAMPAWQRSQESAADHFGASIALRQGYSYTQGFKLFLEHIDSYDTVQRNEAAAAAKAAQDSARDQVSRNAAETARRQQGPAKDVTGLGGAMADLQVKVSEGAFDFQTAISQAIGQTAGKLKDNHDSASSREDELSKSVIPLMAGKPRPTARVEPWKAALKQRETAAVMDNYAQLPRVEEALARKNMVEAQRLAKSAASGPTANDALPLYYLQLVGTGNQPGYGMYDLYKRHSQAKERSWKFELLAANMVAQRDRKLGRDMMEQQFVAFNKAAPAWPDVIAFYRDNGFVDQAKSMARDCAISMPSYRQACVDNSTTAAERAANDAANDQKAKQLVDKMFKKK